MRKILNLTVIVLLFLCLGNLGFYRNYHKEMQVVTDGQYYVIRTKMGDGFYYYWSSLSKNKEEVYEIRKKIIQRRLIIDELESRNWVEEEE